MSYADYSSLINMFGLNYLEDRLALQKNLQKRPILINNNYLIWILK